MSGASAREDLIGLKPDDGFTESRWAAKIDAILAQHAHELAEKIRNHEWRECCGRGCSDGPDEAADLIDPEATP